MRRQTLPFHRLQVYAKSYELALELHKCSLDFPTIEQYALGQQLRASSKSVPVNIAEGMGKQGSPKDVVRFIRIAIGSCDETQVWLDFALDLGYIDVEAHTDFHERYKEVGRMLTGLVKKWRREC